MDSKYDNYKSDPYSFNYSINSFKEHFNTLYNNQLFALCILDIHNFKYFNFKLGYEYGNKILETVFKKVQNVIAGSGYIYKLNGDIFLIVLNNIINREKINFIVDKIITIFDNVINIGEEKIKIIINIGISIYPEDSKDIFSILKYAEIALNYCKMYYENSKFFEHTMYEKIIAKSNLESDLIDAVCNNEFLLFYQPQIDFVNSNVYGIEALLRWNHPEKGIISPSSFIDIVEQNGQIKEIGEYVFQEACKELSRIHELGYSNMTLSINISEKQLEDSNFISFIENILQKTRANPKYINIEITERMFLSPTQEIINALSTLRNMGMKILIDDFGTKYSSLNYLYCLPIDGIKIDKSFINRIHQSEKDLIIAKNIVNLAHELNLEVIAEGVEENEQLMKLTDINCTKIQGYFFGKPVAPDELIFFLENFYKSLK